MVKDPLPADHDAVILANTVHVLSVNHNLELFGKIRAAVPLGARLLLVDLWTDATHAQPPTAALMSGEFLIISGDVRKPARSRGTQWSS